MRRQVSVLVAVISTAIVASFVIPLLLLVNTLAGDRAMAVASQQANSMAMLVSSLHDDPRLADLLQPSLTGSPAATSVVLADGHLVGEQWPEFAADPAYQRARQGQAFSVRDAGGGHVYVPVVVDGGVAVIRASMTPDQQTEGVPLAWISIIALGLGLSAVAVFVGAQVGRGVSRPLLAVAATAHRLREGDLAARAPLAGPVETVELGSALNGLAERIGQLLAAERDSVRGLAHRLRTPVTALRLEAEQVADPEARDELAGLIGQLQVAIDGVVAEARRPLREDLPTGCDAVAVVAARIDYWRPLAEDQGRAVEANLPERPVRVVLSASDLTDIVDICIDNIFAHTQDGVGFRVGLERSGRGAVLLVRDEGAGFPATPAERRPGTSGLGLQLARRTVEQVHGSLAMSAPGQPGAEVTIEIPVQVRAEA
jgi:signal transduction histidine kinase